MTLCAPSDPLSSPRQTQQLVVLPAPGGGAPTSKLHGDARLVGFQWHVRCVERPEVFSTGDWLDTTVQDLREKLGEPGSTLTIRYEAIPPELQRQLGQLRTLDAKVARGRRALLQQQHEREKMREDTIRALSAMNLLPSEVAEILGLPLSTVVAKAGSEPEARIARGIFRRAAKV
jgi:hypothetical protein